MEINSNVKRFCSYPFTKATFSPSGNVFFCCPAWLDLPIGNIFKESFEDIWNSRTAQKIRRSILDENFKYCNPVNCPRIVSGAVKREPQWGKYDHFMETRNVVLETGPWKVSLNYDNSCNLYCKSCRNNVIVLPKEKQAELIRFQDSMLTSVFFKHIKEITITGAGEALSSPVYMDLLSKINSREHPGLKMILRTNGLLLTPGNWKRLENIHYAVNAISISIDAACEDTYRRLRRGGDFNRLLKNLEFLKELKKEKPFKLWLHFVVQKANYREMSDFLRLAKKYNADRVLFGKLFNLGTYEAEDYRDAAVHEPANPEFSRFKELLKDPVLKDPIIRFQNLSNFVD